MDGDERTEKYKTSCKECVFAEWEDGVQKDTCELGRLEKYIDKGKAAPQEDGYFMLETVCCACRGNEWLQAQPIDRSAISLIEEEIQAKISFVIISIDDDPEDVIRLLPRRVSECFNQKVVQPKQIIVVLKNDNINDLNEVYDIIKEEAGPYGRLVNIVNPEYDFARSLDLGIGNIKSQYYCVVQLEHNVPINMLNTINSLMNIDIEFVAMIQPRNGGYSGLVVQTILHKIFGGNRVQPIYEKIAEAAKIQNREHQIFDWEDIWTRQKLLT